LKLKQGQTREEYVHIPVKIFHPHLAQEAGKYRCS